MADRQQTQQPVIYYATNNPNADTTLKNPTLMVNGNGWDSAKKRGNAILKRLNDGNSNATIAMHWFYFIIKVLTLIVTLFGLVVGMVVCGSVLFYDSPELSVFVANTFYTTNDNEQNISWQMITSPSWNGLARFPLTSYSTIAFEHYYECLWVAQIGWPLCNTSSTSVATYQTCLQANYANQLAACTSSNSSVYIWPTANQYSNCVTNSLGGARWNLNALKTCIRTDVWPLYEVPQDVDTNLFLGSFSWPLLMLTSFFLMLAFAIYTIWPLDWEDASIIEYGRPKGAFHRLGMCWTLLPIMMVFVWTGLMLAVAFRAGGGWPNANTNLYPSTQQTNVIILTASFSVLFYFLIELSEFQDTKVLLERAMKSPFIAPLIPIPLSMNSMSATSRGYSSMIMGDNFPAADVMHTVRSLAEAGKAYTPVLLNTWADAYLLDPLFIVGAMGATLQMSTIDVYNVFVALMVYRVLHIGVSRMVYQAYVIHYYDSRAVEWSKDDSSLTRRGKKNEGDVYGPIDESGNAPINHSAPLDEAHVNFTFKVVALAFHIGAICALVIVFYLLFDSARLFVEYPMLISLIITTLLIPEILRLLGHLLLVVASYGSGSGQKGVLILVFIQFIWFWDLLIRVIFVWLYFWGDAGNRGTKPFLTSRFFNLTSTLGYTMT